MPKTYESKIIRKTFYFKTTNVDEERHRIRGIFSTGDKDRQGEVVHQDGWKLDEFMQNPVVLFAHDHWQPAVGKVTEIKVNGEGNLEGEVEFAANEYDFAATLFKLYAGGFMRAFSAGFMNDEYTIDQEESVVHLLRNTLYEMSCVNVPANAMALAYSKGIDTEPIARFMSSRAKERKANAGMREKPEPETTGEYVIIRVKDPGYFDPDSFRTITVSAEKGIKATVGCKKGEYEGGKCNVGTEVQRYLFDKEKWTETDAQAWVDEHKEQKEQKQAGALSASNIETLRKAMGTIADVLNAHKGQTPPSRSVSATVVSAAIRQLLKARKAIQER